MMLIVINGETHSTSGMIIESSQDKYIVRVEFQDGRVITGTGEAGNGLRQKLREQGVRNVPSDW